MRNLVTKAVLAGLVVAGAATAASAASPYFYYNPYYHDGTQAFHSRAIAGAAPNAYSTFIYGVRCSYEYRNIGGARVRYQVCN